MHYYNNHGSFWHHHRRRHRPDFVHLHFIRPPSGYPHRLIIDGAAAFTKNPDKMIQQHEQHGYDAPWLRSKEKLMPEPRHRHHHFSSYFAQQEH